MSDVHLSRLAGWVVRQFGKAMLISMGVAFVGSLVAGLTDDSGWLPFAFIGAGLAFALVLATAEAPNPYTLDELGLDAEEVVD